MSVPLNRTPPRQARGSLPAKTNALAIAAFVTSFFIGMAGVIMGHVSLHQIKTTGEGGRWLAIAALAIGYSLTAIVAYYVASLLSSFS